MLIPNARVAASFNWSLSQTFNKANTTDWLTFCVGPKPDDTTIENIVDLTDAIIVDNTCGLLASNAGATWGYSSTTVVPPIFYNTALPTVKTFNATKSGTITHAVVNASGFFIIVDVGVTNSGAVIQLDTVDVEIGTPVTLTSIQYKVW